MAIPAFAIALVFAVAAANPFESAAPASDDRDSVVLKNGKEIRCRVILELADKIAIRVGTRERWIARKDIRSVQTVFRSLSDVLRQFDAAPDTVERLLELAQLSKRTQLPHEAQLFYHCALLADANNVAAHEALGHKRFGSEWRVPVDGIFKTSEDAEKIRAKWDTALNLRSEHFELRTDAGLQRAVFTLLELESFYRHLFETFQQPLELREFTEPFRVHLYRSQTGFPRLSGTVQAYYSPEDNILFTFLDDDGRPLGIFREAVHAMVYNLGGSKRGRAMEAPGWLYEGWADFMQGCLAPGKNGRLTLDLARRVPSRIGNLRAEKNLYKLRRLLVFKRSDFEASTRQALKYGQSYALMLFMMEGDKGQYQERFLRYMKDAIIGKASASAFRRVFAKELPAIEKGYVAVQ